MSLSVYVIYRKSDIYWQPYLNESFLYCVYSTLSEAEKAMQELSKKNQDIQLSVKEFKLPVFKI